MKEYLEQVIHRRINERKYEDLDKLPFRGSLGSVRVLTKSRKHV